MALVFGFDPSDFPLHGFVVPKIIFELFFSMDLRLLFEDPQNHLLVLLFNFSGLPVLHYFIVLQQFH